MVVLRKFTALLGHKRVVSGSSWLLFTDSNKCSMSGAVSKMVALCRFDCIKNFIIGI